MRADTSCERGCTYHNYPWLDKVQPILWRPAPCPLPDILVSAEISYIKVRGAYMLAVVMVVVVVLLLSLLLLLLVRYSQLVCDSYWTKILSRKRDGVWAIMWKVVSDEDLLRT